MRSSNKIFKASKKKSRYFQKLDSSKRIDNKSLKNLVNSRENINDGQTNSKRYSQPKIKISGCHGY